jgi:hypothetical protein
MYHPGRVKPCVPIHSVQYSDFFLAMCVAEVGEEVVFKLLGVDRLVTYFVLK